MTEPEAQCRAILNVISEAAQRGHDLPEIKSLAEMMGIPYRQFNDRLYTLLLKQLVTSERNGVYTVNGVDVYFGPRTKRRPKRNFRPKQRHCSPEPAAKYVSFERQCLCCGSMFKSQKRVKGSLVTTLYRLCCECRTGHSGKDRVDEVDEVQTGSYVSNVARRLERATWKAKLASGKANY